MILLRLGLTSLAVLALAVGNIQAEQELPTPFEGYNPVFPMPDVSGAPTPGSVTTQNVQWDGSGSVTIPFTTSIRGYALLAIYRTGSSETGLRGPVDSWLRVVPQDLYVNHVVQDVETGNNSFTWDGNDFEGNAAGAGDYVFDIVVVGTQDKPMLVGPSERGGAPWGETRIDIKQDPPEVWAWDVSQPAGNYMRGTIGTDYLANPTAWESWTTGDILAHEGAFSFTGMLPDDKDPEVYWQNDWRGEMGGTFKLRINRSAQSFERDTSFGDNGFVPQTEDRNPGMDAWGDKIYVAHWSVADNPATGIEFRDKTSGEIGQFVDLNDFFTQNLVDDDGNEFIRNLGPGKLDAKATGMWTSAWRWDSPVVHVNHDGQIVWANVGPGDGIAVHYQGEVAAELGVRAEIASNIHEEGTANGEFMFLTEVHTTTGAYFTLLGRDGTGLQQVICNRDQVTPAQNAEGRYIPMWELIVVDEGGAYDGLYYGTDLGMESLTYTNEEDQGGAGMLLYMAFDVASGNLGADVESVVEAVEGAGTPDSYALGAAYPNPFNPETTIEFSVPGDGHVKIEVFNAAGQLLSSLVDEELSAGTYKTMWDALDHNGMQVSSGVYFYRMQAGEFAATHSMTLLK